MNHKLERELLSYWLPPEELLLSEWADNYAYLSPESSGVQGTWRTIPYQQGIMDEFISPASEMVTVMKSARVGYTKMVNWDTGYHIHHAPCSQLIVQPTEDDAQGYSRDELETMIRDIPVLTKLVADAKSRDSGNTIKRKIRSLKL